MAKEICYGYLFYCLLLSIAQFGCAVPLPLLGGKKLIIGIPKSFGPFVVADLNPSTNQVDDVSGYSIEVFNATVNHLMRLGFNVSYEFRAFVDRTAPGNPAGSYDQLLQQLPAKKYDLVVGDITILANRINYMDFTLPYTESSARMLVRVHDSQSLNMWTFLRPFSWDLWVTMFMACVFVGATIRFMERKENSNAENEGSTRQRQPTKISLILWHPLVQMVLSERESVAKNCSKFVLVVWLMLAFVLMQGYTASLSSILTLNQLQPTYLTLDDLKRNGEYVGYPPFSFIRDLMLDSFEFDKLKLKELNSYEDAREALDKGSRNGGVAAIFHEEPHHKVFLKRYGSKYYKIVGPRYHTGGLGFAFPINSTLTSYFSRAILNVSQSEEMEQIERKYFGSNDYEQLQDQSNASIDTRSLTTHSFAGLFMITGFLTFLAVLVSESPTWLKPLKLAKIYCHKCLSSILHKRTNQSENECTNVGSTEEPNNHPEIHSVSPFAETLPV